MTSFLNFYHELLEGIKINTFANSVINIIFEGKVSNIVKVIIKQLITIDIPDPRSLIHYLHQYFQDVL